jgi:SAM-dependent methyltransferase
MPSANHLRSAQEYWDASAETYEKDFSGTLIGQLRRRAVWSELDRVFHLNQRVLELNCGTGIDAVHVAERGVRVLACDISPRMIELARERVIAAGLETRVELRVLATENIDRLCDEGHFDGVLSNFSGLNCVEDVSQVARHLARLLKPGAPAVFCMMGRYVPWEVLWFAVHGEPRRAILRWRNAGQAMEMQNVVVRCPSLREITSQLGPQFRRKRWKGVGVAVPPSYMEAWAQRFPRTTKAMAQIDRALGHMPLLRSMGDCVVTEFEFQCEGEARL